jgi:rare lipoprotein A
MRSLILAAVSALAISVTASATPAHADGWTDTLSSHPFATQPSAERASGGGGQRKGRSARAGNPAPAASSGGGSIGVASYYWQPQRVASGGWFNPSAMTAAHKSLPFGTRVRVTHLGNGRSVDVTINDRGPYIAGRIIDLSRAAAGVINMQGQGIAQVRMQVLGR